MNIHQTLKFPTANDAGEFNANVRIKKRSAKYLQPDAIFNRETVD